MTKTLWIIKGLCIVFLMTGCEETPVPTSGPDAVVAQVNDTVLTMRDMSAEMQTAMLPVATSQMKQEWVQKWIQNELLYQEALNQDLHRDRKIARELQRMQRDYLANILLERVLSTDSTAVNDVEILQYYEENQKEFIRQEPEYRLSVIVLQNENIAREVWRQVIRGREDFGEMARTRSLDVASAQRDGDLGFLKRGDISDPAFRDLVFGMRVGELSKPVLTESGYCIVQVTDLNDIGSVRELDEVRGEIVNRVLEERRRDRIKQFVAGLRKEAGGDVKVNRFHLIQRMEQEPTASGSINTE